MGKKFTALTDADYTVIGRRHGSATVDREANDAIARWKRDVIALAPYSHGNSALARFEALREEHRILREKRPDAVAQKIVSVAARNAAIEAGWAWVNKVTTILGALARTDADLATKLAAATPDEDSELATKTITLKGLLEANATSLDPEVQAAERISEAVGVATAIRQSTETATSAKGAPVADTAELDLLDGKLYVMIKDLNDAGRRAIRDGALAQKSSEYRFQHLTSGSPKKATGEEGEDDAS